MHYFQIYRDGQYRNLLMTFPTIPVTYDSVDSRPDTITVGTKQYKYFDGYGMRIRYPSTLSGNPPFSSARNRFPNETTLYFKNGVSVSVQESNDFGSSHQNRIAFQTLRFQNRTISGGQAYTSSSLIHLYAIELEYQNSTYIGFMQPIEGLDPSTIIPIFIAEVGFWQDALQEAYDYGGTDDPDGGHGSGSYGHTGVSDTVAPLGLMPTGGRGLHYYKIDGPAYQSLQGFLWGDTGTLAKSLWAKFVNKTHTPVSCVVGCFALPQIFAPAGSGSSPIQLAGVQLSPISGTCVPFSPACVDKEYTFAPQAGAYKNFADYTHTTCKLYVPFCGSIPIPMELALNRTILIRYRVDQANGNLCAAIFAGDCIVGELSGNCAYQIPVSGGDTGALEVLGATVTGLVQISTGDFRGALQSGAEALTAQHTTQLINGDLSGNVSYCSLRKPYIEYTRNATTYTGAYDTVNGIPARIGGTLQSFAGGYGEFDIELVSENFPGATAQELEEIATLLRGGVFV